MTVDSIPISKLGQRGAGFMAAHGLVYSISAYAAIASSPKYASFFAFMFSESFYECSHTRHALQVSQPASKPGRPHD